MARVRYSKNNAIKALLPRDETRVLIIRVIHRVISESNIRIFSSKTQALEFLKICITVAFFRFVKL